MSLVYIKTTKYAIKLNNRHFKFFKNTRILFFFAEPKRVIKREIKKKKIGENLAETK